MNEPKSLSDGTPQLNFTLWYDTTFGGAAGSGAEVANFDSAIVYGGNALRSIAINGGSEVAIWLAPADPALIAERQRGRTSPTLALSPDGTEYWESLSVLAGDLVNQLTVIPSVQPPLTWPVKAHSAKSYAWSPPEGYVLAGFSVTYGSGSMVPLRTLTPVAVKFDPATGLTPSTN